MARENTLGTIPLAFLYFRVSLAFTVAGMPPIVVLLIDFKKINPVAFDLHFDNQLLDLSYVAYLKFVYSNITVL